MKQLLRKYLMRLAALTVILGLTGLLFFKTFLSAYYLPVFWLLLLFYFVIHTISQSIIILAEKIQRFNFGNVYLISFVFKFFSYILFLVIYLIIKENINMAFALIFFSLYLIYTIFDVRMKILFSKTYAKKIEISK